MALAYGMQKSPVSQLLAHFILRLIGWRTHVIRPHTSKYVLIGAPHTSNWDFGIMLLLMAADQLPIRFMGKDSLFRGPLGPLMRSLGGSLSTGANAPTWLIKLLPNSKNMTT